jgi:hypothetical protein
LLLKIAENCVDLQIAGPSRKQPTRFWLGSQDKAPAGVPEVLIVGRVGRRDGLIRTVVWPSTHTRAHIGARRSKFVSAGEAESQDLPFEGRESYVAAAVGAKTS